SKDLEVCVCVYFRWFAEAVNSGWRAVDLGTRIPKGLLASLPSFDTGALCSSDFGLTLAVLKGVHRLPTTKDSDTADLDSISVAPTLEPDAKASCALPQSQAQSGFGRAKT
uniref:Uncharacterized protein n=1 Tax=Cyclopterus lumpus TaxID=8103 RepID=A0A8C2WEZ6_CYCLU